VAPAAATGAAVGVKAEAGAGQPSVPDTVNVLCRAATLLSQQQGTNVMLYIPADEGSRKSSFKYSKKAVDTGPSCKTISGECGQQHVLGWKHAGA
jgi:hypothetical protein